MDAGNLLKPMLGRGELRCIGATTLNEYRKYIEKDPALERRFQQVFCGQPSVEDTISILRGLRERYELHHGVKISDSALVSAAVLADRYITERFLPDKGMFWAYHSVFLSGRIGPVELGNFSVIQFILVIKAVYDVRTSIACW